MVTTVYSTLECPLIPTFFFHAPHKPIIWWRSGSRYKLDAASDNVQQSFYTKWNIWQGREYCSKLDATFENVLEGFLNKQMLDYVLESRLILNISDNDLQVPVLTLCSVAQLLIEQGFHLFMADEEGWAEALYPATSQ